MNKKYFAKIIATDLEGLQRFQPVVLGQSESS